MSVYSHYSKKAQELDQSDQLAHYRDFFVSKNENLIYLDGNSLGRLPKPAVSELRNVIEYQWGQNLIRSWNEHWIGLQERLAEKIAQIVGAQADEIFVGDSTSVNFFKLAFAALKIQQNKSVIVSDELNFPSDLYLIQGLINTSYPDHKLLLIKSRDGISIDTHDIESILDEKTALLTLSHVLYRSAFMYDMEKINALAHKRKALVLWDLSHATGAVRLQLNESGADMAVGCTYKYLNGGPGSPAFLFVRKELQKELQNPVWGWFGHQKPFDFESVYVSNQDIKSFGAGTPPILSMAALEPSLKIITEAGITPIRHKSVALSEFFKKMTTEILLPNGYVMASPSNPSERGSHVSLRHPEGFRICKSLIEPANDSKSIIPDFRPPDYIRFGFAPLYNTFTEMVETVARLEQIIKTEEFKRHSEQKPVVT